MKRALSQAVLASILLLTIACGDSPVEPTAPGNQPPPPPPPPNTAPVIESISVQGSRRNQPANFADVAEKVNVTATVRDQETPLDQLQYVWTATTGTFLGTGARVQWEAPAQISTITTVTLTLEVIEKYGMNQENRVTKTAELSLHDSVKEIGDMARLFLLEFSDSNIRDSAYILRNFTEATKTCRDGKASEAGDIDRNRVDYRIVSSSIGTPAVTVDFGGRCAFRSKPADGCARIPASWSSIRLTAGAVTPIGGVERVRGADQVTAVYVADQRRWGLCESDYDGEQVFGSTFIR